MTVSEYIVQFLIEKKITDVFGYPGGSVTNLMEALRKREDIIKAHVVCHEQAAAFAACAYAQTHNAPGVAYATGGPGATNLLTGIGHAYYDSIPTIFFTGNVNIYEAKGDMKIRQRGFQESDNIAIAKPFTKYSAYVDKPEKIGFFLQKAFHFATEGRPGPVLLDLPMNVQRANINEKDLAPYTPVIEKEKKNVEDFKELLTKLLRDSKAPCIVLGNGVKSSKVKELAKRVIENFRIPYVTSMIAFDILGQNEYYQGFIGAYGVRLANFVTAKSDLIISIGSRLDVRQVGAARENFASKSKIVRVDIDKEELKYKVHDEEYSFCMDVQKALQVMDTIKMENDYSHWLSVCQYMKEKLSGQDNKLPNDYMREISALIPSNSVITTDVGQNQVWVAQSFEVKDNQTVLFSGGMGAMGHGLPAAIGAFYGGRKKVFCICGDGGLQMNIQELHFIAREKLPIKIIVFNNNALGMIRHFQEMYFDKVYYQTNPSGGYTAPEFAQIANAYGIRSIEICRLDDIEKCKESLVDNHPVLIDLKISEDTYVIPKLEYGKPNQDQQPLISRKLYKELMDIE